MGASWDVWGSSWEDLGEILGSSWTAWGRLGVILGGVAEPLGASWSHLEAILGSLEGSWAAWSILEPSWGHLGQSWDQELHRRGFETGKLKSVGSIIGRRCKGSIYEYM